MSLERTLKSAFTALAILIWSTPALATTSPPVCTDLDTFVLCVEEGSVPFSLSEVNYLVSDILQAGSYPPVTITFVAGVDEENPKRGAEYDPASYDITIYNPSGDTVRAYIGVAHELWHHRLQDGDAWHCVMMESQDHWWSLKKVASEHNLSDKDWFGYAMYVAASCMQERGFFGEEDTK